MYQAELETPEAQEEAQGAEEKTRTPRKNKVVLVLLTVGRKLIINPNTHATVLGLIWAMISFR